MAKSKAAATESTTATTTEGGKKEKPKGCVISQEQWKKAVAAIQLEGIIATKKDFASGTFGYYGQVSQVVTIDGVPVKLTGQVQLFVANSKLAE